MCELSISPSIPCAYCPHKLAPLFFGRNEECGLRCIYHGWKFDVDGKCVDVPNVPVNADALKRRIAADVADARAYFVQRAATAHRHGGSRAS